jgi:hypothetical protein
MTLACLFGRHWPVAAFTELQIGPEQSRCADCGVAMAKEWAADWRVAATGRSLSTRWPILARRAR